MNHAFPGNAMIKNTSLDTVMSNNENWGSRTVCQSPFNLIPWGWEHESPFILSFAAPRSLMPHHELRVAQNNGSKALVYYSENGL